MSDTSTSETDTETTPEHLELIESLTDITFDPTAEDSGVDPARAVETTLLLLGRLADAGMVVRIPRPDDGRGVLAEITPRGRAVVEAATRDLVATDFALEALSDEMLGQLSALLHPVRRAAGDFTE